MFPTHACCQRSPHPWAVNTNRETAIRLRAPTRQATWAQETHCKHSYCHSFQMLNTQNTLQTGPMSTARSVPGQTQPLPDQPGSWASSRPGCRPASRPGSWAVYQSRGETEILVHINKMSIDSPQKAFVYQRNVLCCFAPVRIMYSFSIFCPERRTEPATS